MGFMEKARDVLLRADVLTVEDLDGDPPAPRVLPGLEHGPRAPGAEKPDQPVAPAHDGADRVLLPHAPFGRSRGGR